MEHPDRSIHETGNQATEGCRLCGSRVGGPVAKLMESGVCCESCFLDRCKEGGAVSADVTLINPIGENHENA